MGSFARDAVIHRNRRWTALTGLVMGGWLLGLIAWAIAGVLRERLGLFNMGTLVYKRAQWGSTVALAACLAVDVSFLTWLVARSLRGALGLPEAHLNLANDVKFVFGVIGGIFGMIVLLLRGVDEIVLRYDDSPMFWSIAIGIAVNLLFAYDVPRLVRNALEALRVRWPLYRARQCELDALPSEGRVRLRGTLADGILRGRGMQVAVDWDPDRTIVEGRAEGEVEIIGDVVTTAGGGYRDGPARIGPGRGVLYIFEGWDRITRRLLAAAVVELMAAGGLLLSLVGLLIFAGLVALRVR